MNSKGAPHHPLGYRTNEEYLSPNKINQDVEKTYRECEGCQREAISKVKKTCEVIPPNLTQVAPAESISIDYRSYNNQDILVIKERSSGFIAAKL